MFSYKSSNPASKSASKAPSVIEEPKDFDHDPKWDNFDFPCLAKEKQNGHPGWLTDEQQALVYALRGQLEQAGIKDRLDTLTLLRFLRARKFDLNLAKQMFLEDDAWRREEDVDTLRQNWDYPEKPQVFQYYPQYYHKTDKDGRPVYIEKLEKVDLTALGKITKTKRMLQNLIFEFEKVADPRLPACSREVGSLVETCCTIMDLKGVGVGLASSVYGYLTEASKISQNHYPERMGKFYVINAPWGFSTVFSWVKGLLDPVTVAKIHILGYDYKTELLKQIPAENLPVEFGGTCNCEGGCELSDKGPWHDPKFAKPPKWAATIDNDQVAAAVAQPDTTTGAAPAPPQA